MKNIKSKDFKDSMEKVEFKVYKNLNECIDSLLFPKETVIAELNCEIENTKINVCLDVFGEVRIFYKDELYLDPNDFPEELKNIIAQNTQASVILVDLNSYPHDEVCQTVFYLVEPSIIKLNKAIRREPSVFNRIRNKNVILNKSLLSGKDIRDFEMESNIKVFYNMPPLDERQRNSAINDFLTRIGIISQTTSDNDNSGRVFGLFRR